LGSFGKIKKQRQKKKKVNELPGLKAGASTLWHNLLTDYAKFTSTTPAFAGSVPGSHSTPGLKARGFLARLRKNTD
jgi:hypothetical protein